MEVKEWLTVAEAAALTGKSARAIYEWIEDGRLAMRRDPEGRMVVLRKAVIRIASEIHRGRPRGTVARH